MTEPMKKIITLLFVFSTFCQLQAQTVTVDKPTAKAGNDFAIVIDNVTYEHTAESVLAYRDALQDDGLSTWILRADWQSPDQVREQLGILRKRAKKLEGIVLIGDIPVVMVRNAQHFTTAFKMDEKAFDRTESSVGSDRFYDTPDLKFEYIDKDEDFWYYRLKDDSPQKLQPAFYSGRIKYPPMLGGDKYEAIARFLGKAVDAKRHPQDLDNIVTFAGHGYTSDCLNAWLDESIMLRECFPGVKPGRDNLKQLDFRMDTYMKYRLFDQLQRPEVDAFFFNEHGSIDKQHISGGELPSSTEEWVDQLKWGYGGVYMELGALCKKMDKDEAIAKLKAEYHLTDKFFDDYFNKELRQARAKASKEEAAKNIISLEDLEGIATQPRFVVFNACYNGSFHRPGSIAAYYIFGEDRTVACQGNTVNVLQDRWTYDNAGLLSLGCRVGEYNRLVATLEGHIVGDPTFHFNPVGQDFRGQIAAKAKKVPFWRKTLAADDPALQAVGLRMLFDAGAIDGPFLLEHMRNCPYGTVRMECLKLLSRAGGDAFVSGIRLGLDDRYELVRRNAAIYAGKCGDPSLAAPLLRTYLEHPEDARVAYDITTAMRMMDADGFESALEEIRPTLTCLDVDKVSAQVSKMIKGQAKSNAGMLDKITDKSVSWEDRKSSMRLVRNNNHHAGIPKFLSVIADPGEDTELRVIMAEALGWFTYSYRKAEIIAGCQDILSKGGDSLPDELRGELTQTILRLQ